VAGLARGALHFLSMDEEHHRLARAGSGICVKIHRLADGLNKLFTAVA
jgi:hypothetical protein